MAKRPVFLDNGEPLYFEEIEEANMAKKLSKNGELSNSGKAEELQPSMEIIARATRQMQIEADMKGRETACAKKIEETLKEFKCGIFAFNTVDPQSGVAIPKATVRALPPTE